MHRAALPWMRSQDCSCFINEDLGYQEQEVKLPAQVTHALSHRQRLTPTLYLRPHVTPREVTGSHSSAKSIYLGFRKPWC